MSLSDSAGLVKKGSKILAALSSEVKDKALKAIIDSLKTHSAEIITENEKDLERSRKENLAPPLLKRLKFDQTKIDDVTAGIEALIRLEDPVGKVLSETELDKDLILSKTACPIGVIGMIFESRPDALVQISTLCLKSGNGVILKGGSEALLTNRILARIIEEAGVSAGLPEKWMLLAETRDDVREMLTLDKTIDLIIPRGSNEFVRYIMTNTTIPVMGHAEGICHAFIDRDADTDKAVRIAVDSKTQYTAVCNALETLLIHSEAAERVLPNLKKEFDARGTLLKGCERTRALITAEAADETDWKTEYLDNILSIKIVDSLEEAVEHIHTYGSGHTETIVTENRETAEAFLNTVDAADVFWNCSTRFSDGYRFGLGAEVGISTSKIHARGPVGMEGLLIYKWKLRGTGQIVADYASGKSSFTHKKIF